MKFTYEIRFDRKNAENVSMGDTVDLTNQDVKIFSYTVNDYVNDTLELFQDAIDNGYENITSINVLEFKFDVESRILSILFDVELSNSEVTDDFVDFKNSVLLFSNSPIVVKSNEEDYELPFEYNIVR